MKIASPVIHSNAHQLEAILQKDFMIRVYFPRRVIKPCNSADSVTRSCGLLLSQIYLSEAAPAIDSRPLL